jgi:hypothetical protein
MTLTPNQIKLLTRASEKEDGFVDAGVQDHSTLRSLIKRGLMIATPHPSAEGRCLITSAGREAVGKGAPPTPTASPEVTAAPEGPASIVAAPCESPARGAKTRLLLKLLEAPEGVTVAAMSEATGWLAHSVRGFMAGTLKKKLGLTVISRKIDGQRLYSLADA